MRASTRSYAATRIACAALGVAAFSVASLAIAGGGGEKAAAPKSQREEARVELGRRLFFDPVVSRAGMRSCADCHDPEHGYSDRAKTSRDDRAPTRRHSQTLVDGVDNPSAHWDGEFRRVEDLVTARLSLSAGKKGGGGHGIGGSGDDSKSDGSSPAPGSGGGSGGSYGGDSAGRGTANGSGGVVPPPTSTTPAPPPAKEDGKDGDGKDGDDKDKPDPPTKDPGSQYRNARGRKPASAGASEREPAPEAAEPAAPSADAPAATAPTAPPASTQPQGAPGAGADAGPGAAAKGSPGALPAAGSAPKADPYADDAFGTTPDDGVEFVAESLENAKLPQANQVMEAAGRYGEAFEAAFGSSSITTQRIATAIAAYCHSIRSGESPYDRFAAGDETALDASAKRGLELFRGKAGCASCHTTTGDRAAFTDYKFHDTGVTWRGGSVGDEGVGGLTGNPRLKRSFKTPTLRDVARRGPFMHDGTFATLEEVVRHYAALLAPPLPDCACPPDGLLDPKLSKFEVTDLEVADLVSFLHALSSDARPGLAETAWSQRPETIRLRFVDADERPLAKFAVTLLPAGDALPLHGARAPLHLETDADGEVVYAPPLYTHVRVALEGGLRPVGGALIPDTCKDALVVVPIRGRARMIVTMPRGAEAPAALVAEHADAKLFPERRIPRTILRREAVMNLADGRQVASYSGPFRTDVPANARVRLPMKRWGMDRLRILLESEKPTTLDLSK